MSASVETNKHAEFCDGESLANIYLPELVKVTAIADETIDTRTLRLEFLRPNLREAFTFQAGQFGLYSVFGFGECVFCIASSPTKKGYIECTFKKIGKVTGALRKLGIGDVMGFRGPYGNSFPINEMKGKNLLFVGGGIGLAPLRSLIDNVLDLRSQFKNVNILYGARSVGDLTYKNQLKEWKQRDDLTTVYTVDPGGEDASWKEKVGFVPTVLAEMAPSADNCLAIVCGPPIMIKFTLQGLEKLGFKQEQIISTLENRMKCGFGKCGRCNIGGVYICKEGPVFTAKQLAALPGGDF